MNDAASDDATRETDDEIAVSRKVAASPERVWELIADLPRMGEWSGENTGGKWTHGSTEAVPGARFRGSNRNGWHRWSTDVTVVEATPGERLSFDVELLGFVSIARWTYEIEATGDGASVVTERWADRRPGWFVPIGNLATGVGDRTEHNRATMTRTLDRLAATAEDG